MNKWTKQKRKEGKKEGSKEEGKWRKKRRKENQNGNTNQDQLKSCREEATETSLPENRYTGSHLAS